MTPLAPLIETDDPDHLDTLPVAVAVADGGLRLLRVNATLCALTGRSPATLLGRPIDDLLAPPSRLMLHTYVLPLLQLHGRVEEIAASVAGPGGTRHDVLLYASWRSAPEAPEDGCDAPRGGRLDLVMVRHQARRELEASLLRVKRAADQTPGMVFELQVRRGGRLELTYASEGIRLLHGCTPEQARHGVRTLLRRVEPEHRRALLRAARPGDGHWHAVHHVCRLRPGPAGAPGPRDHEVQATGRRTADGGWTWHGHVSDVTDRLALEEAARQRDGAESAREQQLQFLTRLSHELRTPLNGILGFAQVLEASREPALAPVHRDQAAVIGRAGRHLLRLIDDVLDISRLQTGSLAVHREPLDLAAVVGDALAVVRGAAVAADVSLHRSGPQPAPWAIGDPVRLLQVVENLLTNAVKYNRPGGRVEVRTGVTSDGPYIEVADSGRGMTPQQVLQLYQPFNRLGAERSGIPGTGLGLAIARQLVDAMGGRMDCTSEPGRGSRFRVTLQAPAPMAATPVARVPPDGRGPRPATEGLVLYVEDDPVNAMLMAAMLEMRPAVRLVVATDAAQALRRAAQERPALLLLDRHLPDADGVDLLARLRALPGLADVPACMVSAAAAHTDLDAARAAGFSDYWTKPLDLRTVLASLDRLLGGT